MSKPKKSDAERLADAIEAYQLGMEAPDPEMALQLLMTAKRRKTPGDPFNATIDQLTEFVFKNPETLFSSEPGDYLKKYLRLASEHVKTMVADKLASPSLDDEKMLNIEVDDDWHINACVEQSAPYSIYVSTNLFLFSARVSELLIAGIGMDIVDDDSSEPQYRAKSPYSIEEVARDMKKILESFSVNQTIARTDVRLTAAHFTFHQIVFHSLLAFITSHEFGHVVIKESRQAGKSAPFSDQARGQIEGNAEGLIRSGRHDFKDIAGLRKLGPLELRDVFSNWENEVNADLIGASLAAEYVSTRGPWRERPGVLGIAYLSFHLCFMAQYFLARYLNLQGSKSLLISKTHPPIDFRMHCVLEWMYSRTASLGRPAIHYAELDAYKKVTSYSQEVLAKIVL